MEARQDSRTKRKFDQLQPEPNPPNKKIKSDNRNEKKDNTPPPVFPPEIQLQILSHFVDDHLRRHARLVCQAWFDIINYSEFRIGALLASETDEFYRIFNRYQKPFSLKFMKVDYLNSIRSDLSVHHLISAPLLTNRICRNLRQLTGLDLQLNYYSLTEEHFNLQYLTIMTPIKDSDLIRMTNLKRLNTGNLTADANPVKFPSNLESLSISIRFYPNQQKFEINTHLTELKISDIHSDLLNAFPNLKKLKVMNSRYTYHTGQLSTRDLSFPNLEVLDTNFNVPDLSSLPNLTKLRIRQSTANISPQHSKLKIIQCLKNINFPENHQSLLQSLESCKVSSSATNKTIINILNSQKITQLITTITNTNYNKFIEFTKLVDLDLTIESNVNLQPLSLPSLTRLSIQIPNQIDMNYLSNLTTLQALFINEDTSERDRIDNSTDSFKVHGLSTFINLTNLFVGPELENWNDLSHLTNLRTLKFCNGYEYDLRVLTSLQKLTYLDMSNNNGHIECLTKLSRLQEITLTSDNERMCHQIAKKLLFCHSFRRIAPPKESNDLYSFDTR